MPTIYGLAPTQALSIPYLKCKKKAIRQISHAKYNAHTEPLFKANQILPLPDLINFFKLQTMQRYSINHIPVSLQGMWQRSNERNIGLNELQL